MSFFDAQSEKSLEAEGVFRDSIETRLTGSNIRVQRRVRDQIAAAELDAKAFREASLRGVDKIVATAKPKSFYIEQSERANEILGGIEIPTDLNIEDFSLGEYREMGTEILANALTATGINFNTADLERWKNVPLQSLASELHLDVDGPKFEELKNNVHLANAQLGVNFANSVVGVVNGAVGLYATTREALEDGELSFDESIQMASSAVSLGVSIVTAYAAGASMGPVGIVAACGAAAYLYVKHVFTSAEQEWEFEKSLMTMKREAHKNFMNDWEWKKTRELQEYRESVWYQQEVSVNKLARVWNLMERKLGVRFDLRYFSGDSGIPRGGYKLSNGKAAPCNLSYGCLYFPDQDVPPGSGFYLTSPTATSLPYLEDPNRRNKDAVDYVGDKFTNPKYAYYRKTIRAMEALVANDPDGRISNLRTFWNNASRQEYANRYFRPRGYWNWVQENGPFSTGFVNFPQGHIKTIRERSGALTLESNYLRHQLESTPAGESDDRGIVGSATSMYHETLGDQGIGVELRMRAYYDKIFNMLDAEAAMLSPITVRVLGDLIGTSNSVQAEMIAANTLRHVFDQTARFIRGSVRRASSIQGMGALGETRQSVGSVYSYPNQPSIQDRINKPVEDTAVETFSQLNTAQEDEISIFDDISKEDIRERRDAERKSQILNASALGLGGVIAYLGNRK